MTPVHLPNANELVDASRLPGFEPGKVAIYFAALLLKQLELPEGLTLGDVLSRPEERDLDQLESWVTSELDRGPTIYRTLRDRLNDRIRQVHLHFINHPGEWGVEPESASSH
jgi:hypothetical protein